MDDSSATFYVFDPSGRHLRTVDAYNNVTLLTLDYNDERQLMGFTDLDGDVATAEWDADDRPSGYFRCRRPTHLFALNTDGYIRRI